MHVRQLTLINFRNYARQEFDLDPGSVLLLGENAQGKTNVLEAVFLLATGRSERSAVDADYIAWNARDDAQPFARIAADACRADGEVSVELTIAGRPGAQGLVASKRFKLNGVARRGSDVAGAVTAVLFTTDDMELVKGAPSGRRRYLDVMLAQVDHKYGRALSRYAKVMTQRNALLKKIGEGSAKRDELPYWDEQLADEGAAILIGRAAACARLSPLAAHAHARLSGEREELRLVYAPRFDWSPARVAESDAGSVAAALRDRLAATHPRDIGAGLTLTGPHRDDLEMTLGGASVATFASRGQQRTAALALRLAEAALLRERGGEQPVLLLDDVLSELDEGRRASVLAAIEADQVLITSPDPDRFPATFTKRAQQWRIEGGTATRLAR